MQIEFHPDEEWLELPQHPRYLISTHGRLYDSRSLRLVPFSRATSQTVPSWSVSDKRPGARSPNRYIKAARAVLETFVGPKLGAVPGFRDGNPENFHLDNLEWVPAPKRSRAPASV